MLLFTQLDLFFVVRFLLSHFIFLVSVFHNFCALTRFATWQSLVEAVEEAHKRIVGAPQTTTSVQQPHSNTLLFVHLHLDEAEKKECGSKGRS